MHDPRELDEVAAELRCLVAVSPRDESDLARWAAESEEIDRRLRSKYPDIRLPIQVLHYMNDGDLRAKDPSYRDMQNANMTGVIEAFERGDIPPYRGLTASISPLSLVGAAGFLGAIILFALYAIRSCR